MHYFFLASLGGAIGAGARHLVNVAAALWLPAGFPWATFLVNVMGSFLMGIVAAAFVPYLHESAAWRTFLATGILGGFTTFSAFSLDAFALYERQQTLALALYVAGSVVLSVAALVLGMMVVRGGLGAVK